MKNKFEYTRTGYKEAVQYLQDIDKLYLIEKELSTDGWSIIHLANSLYSKLKKESYNASNS